jgi:ELWxxDGT repeat protein
LTTSYDGDVPCLNQAYNGTIYASYNAKLHGYGIANNTLWLINNTIESVGCDTYFSWPSGTGYTQSVSHSYGTSLYFTGIDGSDRNLYGYGMENGTIWVESTADPGMWSMMVDDVMYFIGETGNSGYELHGHNLSNGTTWMLDDIFSGSGSITGPTLTNNWPVLVESTFVFGAVFTNGSTSRETWAHNISNGTSWRLSTNDASTHNAPVIGDVVYFTNNNGYGQWELHAYNASNETFWKVVAGPFGDPFEVDGILYGYVGSYSSYSSKLRAHNPANGTTWDAAVPGSLDPLNMGGTLYYAGSLTGTNNVQLWAYEPTNSTGWKVSDLTTPFGNGYGRVFIALGDVIYFTASNGTTSGLWAHSSSNHSTWFVSNPFSSINAAAVAVVNGTLYLGNSGMAGHQPASINYQTNTGGAVTSWAINASLPSGLTFSTTNGSIYGTPTELWTQTSYMVWANNSGGSSMTYLNITVIDQVPVLSYSPSALVLTINAQSTDLPLNATLTGPGAIVSWEINATLPAGLNFGTSNGTIWGIPTVMQTTALTYTIWANNTGGSTSATVTITINDAVPGPFEYEPENSTWLNNSLIHIAPDFINHTNGNGSTWLVADLTSGISGLGPGAYFEVVIGDTIYFDADDGTDGSELWAHNTSNHSTWQVADINSGSGDSSPGSNLYIVVDGVLYFSADDGLKGSELWAHNPANQSTWRVEDINSNFAFGSTPSGSRPKSITCW